MKAGKALSGIFSHSSTRAVAIGFGLIVALMLALLVFTLYRIQGIGSTFSEIVEEHNHHAALVYKMGSVARDRTNLLLSITFEPDPALQKEKLASFNVLGTEFGNLRKTILTYKLVPEELALLEKQSGFTLTNSLLQEQVIALALSGSHEQAARLLVHEAVPAQERELKMLHEIYEFQTGEIQSLVNHAAKLQRQSFSYILAGGIASLILAFFIGGVVYRLITGLVSGLRRTAGELEKSLNELGYQKKALDEHGIVSISDAAGRITYVNDKLCQVSQFTAEELLGQDHHVLSSGLHPKDFFAELWQVIANGRVWNGEVCNRRKDGSLYWLETTIVPFLDEAGRPYQYVAIRTEITRIKEAEQVLQRGKAELELLVNERTAELHEREEVLRLITSAAQDAIVMIDNEGRVSFWNKAAETVFGYSKEEMLGKNPHDFIAPPASRVQHQTGFSRFVQTGEGEMIGKTIEVQALRKDGSSFFADVSLSAVQIKGAWHGIGIARDISNRKQAEALLRKQAETDSLTGIANRRQFDIVLAAEMLRTARYHSPLSLILLDIDHFKKVNDTFGHQAGDMVLTGLSRLISSLIRAQDVFARWGGEEFVILTPNCKAEESRYLAEKLRQAIMAHDFPEVGHVTCSFGVAEYSTGELAETWVGRVDAALYQAKKSGRNRAVVAP